MEEALDTDASAPVESWLRPGARVGRYTIVREAGRGGMAIVYEAMDEILQRRVALKVLHPSAPARMVARLHREAAIAARLRHANIVAVHDVGVCDGIHFIAMDYVLGETLASRLERPIKPRAAVALLRQVAEAVAYAHQERVIHRDLKPANVLIDRAGRPMVTDFGLARQGRSFETITVAGAVMGTPAYMAPEQVVGSGNADPATDVWALGVILYEVLAGGDPFARQNAMLTFDAIMREDPPPPSRGRGDVSPEIEAVCLKAIEKEPLRRYADAGELAAELRRWLDGEGVRARRALWTTRLARRLRRKPWMIAAVASVLAAGAFLGTWIRAELRLRAERNELVEELRGTADLTLRAALELRRAGRSQFMAEQLDHLRTVCAKVSARAPALAEPHYHLGRMYRALMRYDEALAALDEALAREPDRADARYQRGLVRLQLYQWSIEHLRQQWRREHATETVPEDAPIEDADSRQLRAGAAADLQKAGSTVARGLLAWLDGRRDEAKALLLQANREARQLEEPYTWLAHIAWEEGDHEARIEWYTKGHAEDKGYHPFLYGRAMARYREGNELRWQGHDPAGAYRAAIADLDKLIAVKPAAVPHVTLRGDTRHYWGLAVDDPIPLWEAALCDYGDVLKYAPRDAETLANRGALRVNWACHVRKRGADPVPLARLALDDLDAAIELNPARASWWRFRANARVVLAKRAGLLGENPSQEFEGAMADYAQAIKVNPSLAPNYEQRADALESWAEWHGKGTDALPLLERAAADLASATALREPGRKPWENLARLRDQQAECEKDPAKVTELYRDGLDAIDKAIEQAGKRVPLLETKARMHLRFAVRLDAAKIDPTEEIQHAIQAWTRALESAPNDVELLAHRGYAYSLLASKKRSQSIADQANADFDRAEAINPDNGELWHRKGHAHFALGNYRQAIVYYEKAVKDRPSLEDHVRRDIDEARQKLDKR